MFVARLRAFARKPPLSWGFCPRRGRPCDRPARASCPGVWSLREAVPARRRPPAPLPLARPRSPTFAGCHGTPPRLRGFLPRGDRPPRSGLTRSYGVLPLLRLPPLGWSPARCPPSPFGSSGPPMALSRRSSQNDGRARAPSAFRTVRVRLCHLWLTHPLEVRSLSPSCVGDEASCVSTGGAETVPPDAANFSAFPPKRKARIRDPKCG